MILYDAITINFVQEQVVVPSCDVAALSDVDTDAALPVLDPLLADFTSCRDWRLVCG